MKGKSITGGIYILCMMVMASIFFYTACGGITSDTADQSASEEQQADNTPEQEVVQQAAEPDSKAAEGDFVGSWENINDPARFVNITKNAGEYEYEDNEGKLPVTFQSGVLVLKVSGTDTAKVYIDGETGYLISVYKEDISEYKKK